MTQNPEYNCGQLLRRRGLFGEEENEASDSFFIFSEIHHIPGHPYPPRWGHVAWLHSGCVWRSELNRRSVRRLVIRAFSCLANYRFAVSL